MEDTCARLLRYLTAVVSIALALAVPITAMADLITLKLPGITGDVTVEGQQGTIEVLSLTGTIQETVTAPARVSRARRGPPVFSDLMIHKRLDSSSPALFLAFGQGKPPPEWRYYFSPRQGGRIYQVLYDHSSQCPAYKVCDGPFQK